MTALRRRRAPAPLLVVTVLAALLVGLGLSVAAVAAVAEGVRRAATAPSTAPAGPTSPSRTVTESMRLLTGRMDGHPGWPRYTNASWSVQADDTVVLRITSYDDGAAPLGGMQAMMFDQVHGTVGGTETVDGKPVRAVANTDVAHTFTVVGIGLNLPIPAAPTGGSVTVVARFVVHRAGSYLWQCYAPCGSGVNSMGGAMSTERWMEGTVKVVA